MGGLLTLPASSLRLLPMAVQRPYRGKIERPPLRNGVMHRYPDRAQSAAEIERSGWQRTAPCPLGLYDAGGARVGRDPMQCWATSSGTRSTNRYSSSISSRDTGSARSGLGSGSVIPIQACVRTGASTFTLHQADMGPSAAPRFRIVRASTRAAGCGISFLLCRSRAMQAQCTCCPGGCTMPEAHSRTGIRPPPPTGASGSGTVPRWRSLAGGACGSLPAMHRGSACFNGSLYLFGGQQGDFHGHDR